MACVAAKPIVDGIATELSGKLEVIRVNIQDPGGREVADEYQFRFTPTYIFFDGLGEEQWRSIGRIDSRRVRQSVLAEEDALILPEG